MNKKKVIYYTVNSIVMFAAIILFVFKYVHVGFFLIQKGVFYIASIMVAVILANICKSLRLYIIIYGERYKFWNYIKTYFKTNLINIILPFKLGDAYKMLCIGSLLGSVPKGIVTVFLDRFIDTVAIITLVLVGILFGKCRISAIIILLIVFLIIAFLAFFSFPAFFVFWNRYILRLDSNKQRLSVLKMLDILKHMFDEVVAVSKGRSLMLYVLSIMAWVLELGRIVIQIDFFKTTLLIDLDKASDYLMSALGGNALYEYREFACVNILVSFLVYILIKMMRFGR